MVHRPVGKSVYAKWWYLWYDVKTAYHEHKYFNIMKMMRIIIIEKLLMSYKITSRKLNYNI